MMPVSSQVESLEYIILHFEETGKSPKTHEASSLFGLKTGRDEEEA
jgi:hypothetical protein